MLSIFHKTFFHLPNLYFVFQIDLRFVRTVTNAKLAIAKNVVLHFNKILLNMKFLSLEPFIPSGGNFEGSKQLFQELGFNINWDAGDYIGFERDGCKFILQKYDNKEFANNLMINVKVNNAGEFYASVIEKNLMKKFGIKVAQPTNQPYGIEVNVTDIAGVCWHFVE